MIAATTFATLIAIVAATRLDTDASADTLFDKSSESFAATEELHDLFGDEAIPILVQGDLEQTILTENLGQLLRLEGCLSGNIPEGQEAPNEVCEDIADSNAVRAVYGPATFLNQSAIQAEKFLTEQAEAAAAEAKQVGLEAAQQAAEQGYSKEGQQQVAIASANEVINNFYGQLQNLALQTGQSGPPRIDDPRFVTAVVFDSRQPSGTPREDLRSLFPSENAAQITVRLEPGLSAAERTDAISLIRQAVDSPDFRLSDADYLVSGVPVVIEALGDEFKGEVFVLLLAALFVMAIVLAFVFEPPMRLLPLGLALVATALTFGVLSLAGGSLTMASIAVLPILIGLAVDYAIQFQARHREAMADGDGPGLASRTAAARGGPVIATAVAATMAGFAVLLLSPIPMVRGFGILLVIGALIALGIAVTTGLAVLSGAKPQSGRGTASKTAERRRWRAPAAPERLTAMRARSAGFVGRTSTRALAMAIAHPGRVLLVSLAIAAGGWIASTQTEVESDLRNLVPSSVLADAGVDELQEETGVSGELNVIVDAPDITDPDVIGWMRSLKARILAAGGFEGEDASCEAARICPYVFVTDLLGSGDPNAAPEQGEVRNLLKALPTYFSQAFIAPRSATGEEGGPPNASFGNTANMAFGIRVMPLSEQKELIDAIRAEIDPPGIADDAPHGVEASVAGIPALAADANAELSDSRYWLALAGLLAVALVLLAAYRSFNRALVPLIPIVFATGWSALVIEATRIPLNPMSATLGALVIAIATEFSVILSARYREERQRGLSVGEALRHTYSRTGAAVFASGVTAIAGFAVLPIADPIQRIFGGSGIPMLTDFGLVTVVDLAVALLGVMIVLPASLVWAESREGGLGRLPSLRRSRTDAVTVAPSGAGQSTEG